MYETIAHGIAVPNDLNSQAAGKSEIYFPMLVNLLVGSGVEKRKVLRTPGSRFGVTYREGRPRFIENIRALVTHGKYPQ